MTQAGAESAPDGPRSYRWAALAVFAVAVGVALGPPGLTGAGRPDQPRRAPLGEVAAPFGELPVPPEPAVQMTGQTAPDSGPLSAAPAGVDPAPTAAGPPTTVTTGPPARSAPKPTTTTTTTTAAGTVESRGAAALALIDYPWQRTGYSMVFAGPNANLLGLTEPSRKRITIYVRPTQSTTDLARIIGHEIGHAVDFTMTTDAERADYRRIRGLDDRPWYPTCGTCADYASPAGDWAETFAYWLLGNGSFNSQLAGKPTAAQLAGLTPIFTADAAVVPSTTPATRPPVTAPAPKTTTPTTGASQGGTTYSGSWYWYGGGYRRTAPSGGGTSGGRNQRR